MNDSAFYYNISNCKDFKYVLRVDCRFEPSNLRKVNDPHNARFSLYLYGLQIITEEKEKVLT